MKCVVSADEVKELTSPPPFAIGGYPRWKQLIVGPGVLEKTKEAIKAEKISLMIGICKPGGGTEPHSHEDKERAKPIL